MVLLLMVVYLMNVDIWVVLDIAVGVLYVSHVWCTIRTGTFCQCCVTVWLHILFHCIMVVMNLARMKTSVYSSRFSV